MPAPAFVAVKFMFVLKYTVDIVSGTVCISKFTNEAGPFRWTKKTKKIFQRGACTGKLFIIQRSVGTSFKAL